MAFFLVVATTLVVISLILGTMYSAGVYPTYVLIEVVTVSVVVGLTTVAAIFVRRDGVKWFIGWIKRQRDPAAFGIQSVIDRLRAANFNHRELAVFRDDLLLIMGSVNNLSQEQSIHVYSVIAALEDAIREIDRLYADTPYDAPAQAVAIHRSIQMLRKHLDKYNK